MSPPASCPPGGASRRWIRATAVLVPIALALLAVVLNEARLVPRVHERLAPVVRPWTNATPAARSAVRAETRRQLDRLPAVPRLGNRPGLRLEESLGRVRRPPPRNSWANACLALGVLAAAETAPDPADLAALRRFSDRLVGDEGRIREPLHGVEQAMIGPVLLRLGKDSDGTLYRRAAEQLADFLLKELRRTSTGTLPYSSERPEVCLVDTLTMVCPFLAAAEPGLGRAGAADLAVRQLTEFVDRAVDPATGLPWHAYSAAGGPAYGILGWTRGLGWLAVGLAETVSVLPADHPDRRRLGETLERLIATAAARQDADGLWRWCLSLPEGEPDTSGSAMLAWAIERGVRAGVLAPTRREVARRALDGVLRRTDRTGLVGQALGECQAVGHYPRVFGAYPWAQGPTAAALSWTSAPEGTPSVAR